MAGAVVRAVFAAILLIVVLCLAASWAAAAAGMVGILLGTALFRVALAIRIRGAIAKAMQIHIARQLSEPT